VLGGLPVNGKALVSNMFTAFFAQGVSLLLSILQSLIIPKMLGVTQFGYWQLYLFYVSYVGFFHLGLSSGIYLKMGGIPRDKMDKGSVKSQFVFGLTYQTMMALVIIAVSYFFGSVPERQFVIFSTGVYLVLQNAATYMTNVLQCMNETKKSSYSVVIERVSFLIPMIIFMVLRVRSFEPYVLAYTLSTMMQLAYCIWYLRDFIKAPWLGYKTAARQGWGSIKIGINLMLANIASMMILGVARFFIDLQWGIEQFGELSLALSLVSFFLAFVSQASMVLFPALRQGSEQEVRSFFEYAKDALSLLFPVAYLIYFPLVWVLKLWLPNYAASFSYLILLLPICVFDSKMDILCATFFNVTRREKILLKINVVVALGSFVLTLVGVYLCKSVTVVIASITLMIILRSVFSERFISEILGLNEGWLFAAELALTFVFILSAELLPSVLACVIYAASYGVFLWIFSDRLKKLSRKLKPNAKRVESNKSVK
jgi:O-antigen/teichoic acid export membrane protein